MPLTRRIFLLTSLAAAAPLPGLARSVPELNLSRSGLAVRGFDLVSYSTVGKPQAGSKDISLTHAGGTYRFASQANKALFESDPDRFLPAYGGYCAYGTAVNTKVDGDPNIWHIIDDQLYLNITRSVDRVWRRDPKGYIAKANKNWPRIKFDAA